MSVMATYRKSRVQEYPMLVLRGEVLSSTGFFHSQPQGPVGSSLGPDQTQEPRVSLYARLLPCGHLTGSEEWPGSLCAAGGLKLSGKWGLEKVVGS